MNLLFIGVNELDLLLAKSTHVSRSDGCAEPELIKSIISYTYWVDIAKLNFYFLFGTDVAQFDPHYVFGRVIKVSPVAYFFAFLHIILKLFLSLFFWFYDSSRRMASEGNLEADYRRSGVYWEDILNVKDFVSIIVIGLRNLEVS